LIPSHVNLLHNATRLLFFLPTSPLFNHNKSARRRQRKHCACKRTSWSPLLQWKLQHLRRDLLRILLLRCSLFSYYLPFPSANLGDIDCDWWILRFPHYSQDPLLWLEWQWHGYQRDQYPDILRNANIIIRRDNIYHRWERPRVFGDRWRWEGGE